jgi:transcription elongation factor Elf1
MATNRRNKNRPQPSVSSDVEATYICESCGEEIVVPLDVSAGSRQDYVEDCPVCCNPMVLHVDIDPDGEAHVDGRHE